MFGKDSEKSDSENKDTFGFLLTVYLFFLCISFLNLS